MNKNPTWQKMKVRPVVSAERRKSLQSNTLKWRKSGMKPQREKKTPWYTLMRASLRHQGKVFFEESTLHGVRYIAESDRPLLERLSWFVCVLVGTISTMIIIVSLWEKFQTNPTITGLDTDFHNWNISFPAVTLCPNEPWNVERMQAYIETKTQEHNLNETSVAKLTTFLQQLTEISLPTLKRRSLVMDPVLDGIFAGQDLHALAYDFMQRCEELFTECMWLTEELNCCERFFPIFTENGFCYTFNSQNHAKNYADGKPVPEISTEYIKETDIKWSLQFIIATPINDTYNISIYLHKSNELPGVNLKPQHVWDFKMSSMSFSMRETYTTQAARQLSIRQRHCIFDNEVKLEDDSVYTYAACTHQCRVHNAERLCHCVPHFYHQHGNNEFCNATQLQCIAEKKASIMNVEECACELGCSNTIYEVDKLVEQSVKATEEGMEESEEAEPTVRSFEVEFTSWPMIKYKREVLFGWVDLLVSFGGIAGLFLGFSLLSGVEIIYYFTIRACCMVYKQRDELEAMVKQPSTDKKTDYDLGLVPSFLREAGMEDIHGRDIIRSKMNHTYRDYQNKNKNERLETPVPRPFLVPTLNPKKIVMPPFGFDYCN